MRLASVFLFTALWCAVSAITTFLAAWEFGEYGFWFAMLLALSIYALFLWRFPLRPSRND